MDLRGDIVRPYEPPSSAVTERAYCVHHWLIPTEANEVRGTCQRCGAVRRFTNDVTGFDWNDRRWLQLQH